MAQKTQKKKPQAKPPVKVAPKKVAAHKLTNLEIISNNPKVQELMKRPDMKERLEAVKERVAHSFEQIKSPKNFCKIIHDAKSGLQVVIYAFPEKSCRVRSCEAAVFISTIIGNINYIEKPEFENLNRACEYIGDFGQEQVGRFCDAAIKEHAVDVVKNATRQFMPEIHSIMNEGKNNADGCEINNKVAEKK